MKTTVIVLFAFVLFFANTAKAQWVTIPDANFVAWLTTNIPSAMAGNQMDITSPAVTTRLVVNVENCAIADLTGIQYFSSLTTLDCGNGSSTTTPNVLTSLPPLPPNLDTLICGNNQLTSLPELPNSLTHLRCYNNLLTSLPVLPESLIFINCNNNLLANLPALPVSLHYLNCGSNLLADLPALPSLLEDLICGFNQLENLPALPNSLTDLYCTNNLLVNLPTLPNSLEYLECSYNQLTSLPDLPDFITSIICSFNFLENLPDLPNSLHNLYCHNNQLVSLPVLPNSLNNLYCHNNQLVSLPSLQNISNLSCFSNLLDSLPALPDFLLVLRCNNNLLTSLPLLTDWLQELDCSYNNISCFPVFPNSLDESFLFNISENPFTCLPNYVPAMNSTYLSYPLCVIGDAYNNPNGCSDAIGVLGYTYTDNNSNCLKDEGDSCLINIHEMLYAGSSLLNHTFSAINGIYHFPKSEGTYTVKIDTFGVPFQVQCTYPGLDSTVILTTINPLADNVNFSLNCKPGFDIGIQSVIIEGLVFPGLYHSINVFAGDLSQWYNMNCADGVSGQIQVTVNGPVSFDGVTFGTLSPVISGDTYTFNIDDFGNFDITEAFGLIFKTETYAQTGDTICLSISVNPFSGDNYISNNTYDYCYLVMNSHDPNNKEVFPVNVLPGYQDYFTYTIHFQNTGGSPAVNIRIVDTLSSNLDMSTFQLMNYSHPNTTSISGNELTVSFPDIQLPDSLSNPEESSGFIQYRIKPIAGLTEGTQILNKADIYFDYNEPIVTNTTVNLFTETVNVFDISENAYKVFPNPAGNKVYIINTGNATEKIVSIMNMQGNKTLEKIFCNNEIELDLSNIPQGVYLLKIQTKNSTQISKLIIQ